MRVPFVAGSIHRNVSRLRVAPGQSPRPFPGPWTLKAVIRIADGTGGPEREAEPARFAEARPASRLRPRPS